MNSINARHRAAVLKLLAEYDGIHPTGLPMLRPDLFESEAAARAVLEAMAAEGLIRSDSRSIYVEANGGGA